LEQFLISRSLKLAKVGAAQASDNLTRATVFIVESGLQTYFKERDHGMATSQLPVVGHCACIVSRAAAAAIRQPTMWRIPALISTALLLTPWIGLNAAASGSAASVQAFENRIQCCSVTDDSPLSDLVTIAVVQNDYTQVTGISELISERLAAID
jgi:hypothetical protein